MIDSLGCFDRKIAEEIFLLFPEWIKYAKAEDEYGEKALTISIPNLTASAVLNINTFNQEITVCFDSFHCHFENPSDALSLVKKLLSDQYVVISYWRDEQLCGSELCDFSALPNSNIEQPYANKIIYRSWSGLLDRELECTSRD